MTNALEELAKVFDNKIEMPLQQRLIGRKLIPRNDELSGKGIGNQSVETFSFSDISAAIIDYTIPEKSYEGVDATSAAVQMAYLAKDYKIPRTLFESFKLKGQSIDADVAITAAYKVAYAEDQLFLMGWAPDGTNYKIKGLYQSANQTESTSKDFGTYGNAKDKVGAAISLAEAVSVYGPYNIVLNPTQKNELVVSESTTGKSEWDTIIRILNENSNSNIGQIYSSPIITAGTGMLLPVQNSIYFDYVEAQGPVNDIGQDSKSPKFSPIFGNVLEAIVPRIKYNGDQIIQFTNI
ncbi:MAG: bacteriocin family protein [ANME-2 cluster archaeon]|nr:bacteriocin family protein [ANME-2 cluster archaeon]